MVAYYNISWNNINFGDITWKVSLNNTNYKFLILLKNADAFSYIYKFYGEYYAEGKVVDSGFKPKKYYYILEL